MRGINDRFIKDLKSGDLNFFLKQVKSKKNLLSLQIRNDYINIYYRGGNLLKISQKKTGYSFHFDEKYCLNKGNDSNYQTLKALDSSSVKDYIGAFKIIMKEMDSWLECHPKNEREYQHSLLVNNPSIIDIEYQINYKNHEGMAKAMRFDMIMLQDNKIIIVENKYGEGAVSGNAGLAKHYDDICRVLNNNKLYNELVNSINNIASAKFKLGLIDKEISNIEEYKPVILFLLANYNKNSRTVINEVSSMNLLVPASVLFTKGDEYVVNYKEAKDLWSEFK